MARGKTLKTLVAIAVILMAWAAGHAQGQGQPAADLSVIKIDAPGGNSDHL